MRTLLLAVVALAVTSPVAGAQSPPPLNVPAVGGFHSVLAGGEGQSVTAADLAAYQLSGTPPARFVDQQGMYVGVTQKAQTLPEAEIGSYYKDTTFGTMPGGVESLTEPRPGVQIFRDKRFGMAHVYGASRSDVMFGAGYATAQERLFFMDALRRTAKGTLAGLTGASAAAGDAEQLTDQDFSDEELQAQFEALPRRFGAEGQRGHQDILDYVAGINQRIDEVNADTTQLPAEYAALGARPVPWTVPDSVAMAVLLVTRFTVSNGGEEVNAQLQQAFHDRFGRRWRVPYRDFRTAEDPEAVVVAKRTFRSDRPGRVRKRLNAMPDAGSIKPRNPQVSGPGAEEQAARRARMPSWVSSVIGLNDAIPHHASNAVLVAGSLSADGKPLAAMGPQVDYYSPQIFSEYELHGGGIDIQGVTFPGASPYPLIGHGIDYVWSGTSANGDNQDTFVELLCNPDGSAPTAKSTHYRYRGDCIPFVMRDQKVTTPYSPLTPDAPPQEITYRTMRSVHGPVFAFATVRGAPVALTKAKGVNFHELDAVLPFMRLAENQPRNAVEFMEAFSMFPGTENWFYADDRDVAFMQSGRYPLHARGSDVDRPFWGDGRADWRGFDPKAYTFEALPNKQRPRALNPRDGFIISWNNKEARGWRKGPREWSNGPVHHALTLERRLLAEAKRNRGKVDFAGLVRTVNLAATTDVRGQEIVPWLRRVLGREAPDVFGLLDAWHRSGSKRLDADGDNAYDHSAAVALMDAWWPRLVRGIFEPTLGPELFGQIESRALSLDEFGWGWATHVQKDLRNLLGRRVRGRYSRIYCGGPRKRRRGARAKCRAILVSTLREAAQDVRSRRGQDPAKWTVPATCPPTDPPTCDQVVPTTGGAVDTPPFPWQNRGTYHQVDRIRSHRPR